MNLNIKRKDCRFYVDKENRKVVYVIPNTKNLVFDYVSDFRIYWSLEGNHVFDSLRMPNQFTGIATCNEKDEFDEETGKLIAYNKAKEKLNNSFFKRANKFVNYCGKQLDAVVDSLNDFGRRLTEGAEKREAMIKERV